MQRLKGLLLALVLLCVVPFAVACGDDDDDGGGSAAAGAAVTTEAAPAAGATGQVDRSKRPVTVSVVSVKVPGVDLLTPYAAGAKIAAEAINKQGGFGGREVKVTECNSQLSAAGVTTCARRGVADDPIAMFACDPNWGTAGLKILGATNIPSFNCVNGGVDFADLSSFGMSGDGFGFLRGAANWACTQDSIKNVTMFLGASCPSRGRDPGVGDLLAARLEDGLGADVARGAVGRDVEGRARLRGGPCRAGRRSDLRLALLTCSPTCRRG